MNGNAANRQEYALLSRETGNEITRYDTREEADEAVGWLSETYGYGHIIDIRAVKAGSGPVCLGIEDDRA